MSKNKSSQMIRRTKTGIILVAAAALLIQLMGIGQYVYTRHEMRKQAATETFNDMQEVQRIASLKTQVETIVQNAMGEVMLNLDNPDAFFGITSRVVALNEHVVGSAVAMQPGYVAGKDSLYAPFSYPSGKSRKGSPITKLLPYDYTREAWYVKPYKANKPQWSEPYFDRDGSDLLIRTYGQPIRNQQGQVIGILTADVSFEEFTKAEADPYSRIDSMNIVAFAVQLVGLLILVWIVWGYASRMRQVNKLVSQQQIQENELQIAANIQQAMLPRNSLDDKKHGLTIDHCLMQAPDISADFFDYLYVGNKLVFCIGDVPGSNVRAALLMTITRTVFRTAATMQSRRRGGPSPAVIVSTMNEAICSVKEGFMCATLFVGVLDTETRRFTYCNAGNPAPVALSKQLGAVTIHAEPNIPLGVVDDYQFAEEIFLLDDDDFTLFLFNDGLYEVEDAQQRPLGFKRMMAHLRTLPGATPGKVLDKMRETVEKHHGEAPLTDDILMLVIANARTKA